MFEMDSDATSKPPVDNNSFSQISLEDAMSLESELSSQPSPNMNSNVLDTTMESLQRMVALNNQDKFIYPD